MKSEESHLRTKDVFVRACSDIEELAHRSVERLDPRGLVLRAHADANSIARLIRHPASVQDDHISEIAGREQAWVSEGWV